MEKYECKDCGGTVLYDSLSSGYCGNKPVESWCICVDRKTHQGKKFSPTRQVNFHKNVAYIPDYIKNNISHNFML